jgi:hypothetical protein
MKLSVLHEGRFRIVYDMLIEYLEEQGYRIKVDGNWILIKTPSWKPVVGHFYLGWIELDIRNGMLYGNYYDRMGERVTTEWQPSDPELFDKVTHFIDEQLEKEAADFEADV